MYHKEWQPDPRVDSHGGYVQPQTVLGNDTFQALHVTYVFGYAFQITAATEVQGM